MLNRNELLTEVRIIMKKHSVDFFEALAMVLDIQGDIDAHDIVEVLTPDEIRNIRSLATKKHNFRINDGKDDLNDTVDITF